jgi:multicomponent Na+:H+ antiporter subunit E
MFIVNVLLALAWAALVGQFDLPNLLFGFGMGYVMLYLSRRQIGSERYFAKAARLVRFVLYVLWEIVLANITVVRHVLLTPRAMLRPGIVAVPLDLKTDTEIAMLANLITLTPGTLSLDVSDDHKTLFVHAIEVDDPEAFRTLTKQGFEKAVHEVFE